MALLRRNLDLLAVPSDGLERLGSKDSDFGGGVEIALDVELSVLDGSMADEVGTMNQNCESQYASLTCVVSSAELTSLVDRREGVVVQCRSPELVSRLSISQNNGRAIFEVESEKTLLLSVVDSNALLARLHLNTLERLVMVELGVSLKGELSLLALRKPENNDLLVVDDRVSEDFGGRVEECLLAEVEVSWDDLGLMAVDSDCALVLRNGN